MPTNPRQSELGALFDQRKYQGVLEIAKADEITPASDPQAANVVAASLFQLGRFPECLLWCEGLHPALQGEPSFSSMYGAALRRVGRLDDAEKVFRQAISQHGDNKFLQNNFANLLIDKQSFDEAEQILRSLLEDDPSYEDARLNMNRLKFKRNLAETSSKIAQESPGSQLIQAPNQNTSRQDDNAFVDPLEAAFSDEEVKLAGGINVNTPNDNSELNLDNLPKRELQAELQEALSLARQTVETDPQQTINDCTLLHNKLGVQAPIYEVAAEAYIKMQLFGDAETCLLTAHGLGSQEASILLNLANLAAMRGDQRLSLHWLESLAKRQPDHPQLDPVRRNLFPQAVPKTSTRPFQLNLDQRTPGRFN